MDRKSDAYRILPDREQRKLQAIAAAKEGGAETVEVWVAALSQPDASVRAEAAENLGFAWIHTAAPELMDLLDDPAAEVRDRAAFALWRMRRVTLPLIRSAFGQSAQTLSEGWLRLVVRLGQELCPELQALLLVGGREDREFAASALCQIRNFDPELLEPALAHAHLSRRIKAVEILGHTGQPEVLLRLSRLRDEVDEKVWTHKVDVAMRRILRRFPSESEALITAHPTAFPKGFR